jgi:hypothetical protein
LGALAAILLAVATAPPAAAAEVPLDGELVARTACPAFQSLRRRTNPGAVAIEPGGRYAVRGLNQEDGDWVRILAPGADPPERWVERACGTLAASAAGGGRFRPFFDRVDQGPEDMTPAPPPLDAFDRAVLQVCGPWGSRPKAAAFRAMLDRPELAAEVAAIHAALEPEAPRRLARFKDRLTAVWFAAQGFAHIFCGEPGPERLAGLHFRGRYLQLQEWDKAGPMSGRECRAAEIAPPVYALGVWYRTPEGAIEGACPKGYAYDLGARDLLIAATRAYRSLARRTEQGMCLARVPGRDYLAVVVIEAGGVRTFYPDASPACDGGGPVSACACDP